MKFASIVRRSLTLVALLTFSAIPLACNANGGDDCASCRPKLYIDVTFLVQPPEVATIVVNGVVNEVTYGTSPNQETWTNRVGVVDDPPETVVLEVYEGENLLLSGTYTPEYQAGWDECNAAYDEACRVGELDVEIESW